MTTEEKVKELMKIFRNEHGMIMTKDSVIKYCVEQIYKELIENKHVIGD